MKSPLYIKLVFLSILTLVSTPTFAQNSFTNFVCYTFISPHPTALCGLGGSPEDAAGDFCVKRYGFNNGVGFLPNIPRYSCLDVQEPIQEPSDGGFPWCRPSAFTCESTPPANPLELFYYKPLDGISEPSGATVHAKASSGRL